MSRWRNTAERMELESVLARRKAARAWRERQARDLSTQGPQQGALMSLNEASQLLGIDVVRAAIRDGVLDTVNTTDFRGRVALGIWFRRSHVLQLQRVGTVMTTAQKQRLAWTLHQQGVTFQEIGQQLGVSTTRANQYARRETERREHPSNR